MLQGNEDNETSVPKAPPLPPVLSAKRILHTHTVKCHQKELQFRLVAMIEGADRNGIENLISQGVNTNAVIMWARTPLTYALELGHEHIAEMLIENGAEISTMEKTWFGRQPMHFATFHSLTAMMSKLLSLRADVNCTDSFGVTPLHIAACFGQTHAVKWLLDHGANVNVQDYKLKTPFHKACENNHIETVEVLIASEVDINTQDQMGWSALYYAIVRDKLKLTKLILESDKADVNMRSKMGYSPLHIACGRSHQLSRDAVVYTCEGNVYSIAGIKPASTWYGKEFRRSTDLSASLEMVFCLLDAGADVNARTAFDESALFLVTSLPPPCDLRIMHLLVSAGANLDRENWLTDQFFFDALQESGRRDLVFSLRDYRENRGKLKNICRTFIRSYLSSAIIRKSSHLPLPVPIQMFISLCEFQTDGSHTPTG